MKITVTVDCTPEEARAALGLPDVSGIHAIYLDRMKTFAEQGVTADNFADLMKGWTNAGGAGLALMQGLMAQAGGGLWPGMTPGAGGDGGKDRG